MLQVKNVSKWFGDVQILSDISFGLERGDRVGLIGPNGCGKTTLMRVIAGLLAPDRGAVALTPSTVRMGYLPQALDFPADAMVDDVLRAAHGERMALEKHLAELAEAIALAGTDGELTPAMAEYDRILVQVEAMGAGRIASDLGTVKAAMGLAGIDGSRSISELSGGQKTRLGLARLLLQEPDLLLLDEPTNHLDIGALAWLEEFLASYAGALIIVSHDRTFLDRTTNGILALDDKTHTLRAYPGNYSAYAARQDSELEKQWAAYHEQQERVQRLEGSIRKLSGQAQRIESGTIHFYYRRIAKDLARRAVVQRARLERMLESEDVVDKPGQVWKMKLEFADTVHSGQDVLQIDALTVGYDERPILSGVSVRLRRGDRAVLIGENGAGKSTLIRCIAGQLRPWSGTVRIGRGVRLGYMAQEQELLDPASTPLEMIRAVAPMDETDARGYLHCYLFAGDEVFKPIERLSFGERSRLQLAMLSAQGCNFLLLDEPINHLDIPSRESFERAIARFDGTVLAVVHDRYFIERLATRLLSLENGTVRELIDVD